MSGRVGGFGKAGRKGSKHTHLKKGRNESNKEEERNVRGKKSAFGAGNVPTLGKKALEERMGEG